MTYIKPFLPWDGLEPVTDALTRSGLKAAFDLAIEHGKRDEAIDFLVITGVDRDTAERIVAKIFPPARPA